VILVLALLFAGTGDEVDRFAGTWRGDSTCAAKNTACRDESVVYRITGTSVSADKMVDGKPVNMGTLEFHYDAAQQALVCEYAQGVWRLKIDGSKIEGTLVRPDGTLFRRVTLHR
jgi:hypothetical protein